MNLPAVHRRPRPLATAVVFAFLLSLPGFVQAEWSGISFTLGETDTDWQFSDFESKVNLTDVVFRVEQRSTPDFRVGLSYGLSSLRLDPPGALEVVRYEYDFIGVDVLRPFEFDHGLSLEAMVDWRYYSGSANNTADSSDSSWTQVRASLAPGLQIGVLRVAPYWTITRIDGDLGINAVQRSFERKESVSSGLNIDYLTGETEFVRLNFGGGGDEGFLLEFVRRY